MTPKIALSPGQNSVLAFNSTRIDQSDTAEDQRNRHPNVQAVLFAEQNDAEKYAKDDRQKAGLAHIGWARDPNEFKNTVEIETREDEMQHHCQFTISEWRGEDVKLTNCQ